MADALASGASGSNVVWVQVPSSAPANVTFASISLAEKSVRDF